MKDCIKIEEIKMFLGTNLKVNVNEPCVSPKIKWFIYSVDIKGDCAMFDNSRRVDCVPLEDITPLVKPLSSLTDEILKEMYPRIDMKYVDSLSCKDTGDVTEDSYNRILSSMIICNILASKHYDIFNWIGRGLAKEIK